MLCNIDRPATHKSPISTLGARIVGRHHHACLHMMFILQNFSKLRKNDDKRTGNTQDFKNHICFHFSTAHLCVHAHVLVPALVCEMN